MTVGIFEAKQQLNRLVSQVEMENETVIITKHGKPVAKLVPADAETRLSQQQRAAALLKNFGKTHAGLAMTRAEVVDLVREDRNRRDG